MQRMLAFMAAAMLWAIGNSAHAQQSTQLRIAYQKSASLFVLQRAQGSLEQKLQPLGVQVKWLEFPAGPQLLEGLNVGAIDVGFVGEAPPIFAQAAGAQFVYIGYDPAAPHAEAILVPKDSPIRSVADLKDKKVALNKGSNVHYLLLRLVAGLETSSSGLLEQGEQPLRGLNTQARIMLQEARLLPWKRVLDNVLLGLPASERARGERVLAQVGLADRAQEWPARLSGGQRQRVALARALVHQPQLLLLDEPLGALDALTRIEMHRLIEQLWQTHGFTALLVTHDVQEAVALADRVVLIEDGRIALDERIPLPRPRIHGDVALAAVERCILDRVLQKPAQEESPPDFVSTTFPLRWAI